jgi:hypothetical protein
MTKCDYQPNIKYYCSLRFRRSIFPIGYSKLVSFGKPKLVVALDYIVPGLSQRGKKGNLLLLLVLVDKIKFGAKLVTMASKQTISLVNDFCLWRAAVMRGKTYLLTFLVQQPCQSHPHLTQR